MINKSRRSALGQANLQNLFAVTGDEITNLKAFIKALPHISLSTSAAYKIAKRLGVNPLSFVAFVKRNSKGGNDE